MGVERARGERQNKNGEKNNWALLGTDKSNSSFNTVENQG